MSGLLRSKHGCWTCKLRKKKCDETRPHCSTCQSLSITCYGFDARPEWMDHGEREKAVANSIKEIVKHTSRRKAMSELPKQHDAVARIEPKPSNDAMMTCSSSSELNVFVPPSSLNGADPQQYESVSWPSLEHNGLLKDKTPTFISANESVLLMHFLDAVFPLQYPVYKPEAISGRGWLLTLLLRGDHFYHSVLTLSTCHLRMIQISKRSHQSDVSALIQQEKYLEICIKLVNQATQNSCGENGSVVVAAVIQLMFYELYTGHDKAWQAHLRAAINMYQRGHGENLEGLGFAKESSTIVWKNLPLTAHEPAVIEEVVAFRFLSGTIIWLDIISSITIGEAPCLLPYHSTVIGTDSQTKLESIMGCKNRVLLQIGLIAALYEHSVRATHHTCTEVGDAVDGIIKEIQSALSEHDFTTTAAQITDPAALITQLFAYMASIYLHLAISGFQGLELLDATISEAMFILHCRTPPHLLSSLVAPLFVIGCVARKGDEEYFRSVFSSPPLLDPLLKHREKVSKVLEETWRRRNGQNFMWKDCLELTNEILLI